MLTLLGLAGCGRADLDRQQAHEEARTCASLVERVVARARGHAELFGSDPKRAALDPRILEDDPEAFYQALADRLAAVPFGPDGLPNSVSAAARLVARCRSVSG